MTAPVVLGIDLGTSACKVCALDASGTTVGTARAAYPTQCPTPGWAEQNPRDWIEAVVRAVPETLSRAGIAPAAVAGIALTSAAHIGVLLDADGVPVRPAILWQDQRSAREAAELEREAGEAILACTFQAVSTTWTLPHLRWIARQEPESWSQMRTVVLSKDYLLHWLTGVTRTDPATALSSQLYDAAAGCWSDHLCGLAGLSREALPPIGDATSIVAGLTPDAATALGLVPGTPVILGTLDSAAELFAAGAVRPGQTVVRLASAGGVQRVIGAPEPDRRLITYPHLSAPYWYRQAGTSTCATAVEWGRRLFMPEASYPEWDRRAEAAPPGADGLLFHPYLAGERAPHWSSSLRGSLLGLSLSHGAEHIARAIYEGTACSIRDALGLLGSDATTEAFAVVGGGTQSRIWTQILAAVLGRPLRLLPEADSARGAALMALAACGLASVPAIDGDDHDSEYLIPDPRAVDDYAAIYRRYTEVQAPLLEIASMR